MRTRRHPGAIGTDRGAVQREDPDRHLSGRSAQLEDLGERLGRRGLMPGTDRTIVVWSGIRVEVD